MRCAASTSIIAATNLVLATHELIVGWEGRPNIAAYNAECA